MQQEPVLSYLLTAWDKTVLFKITYQDLKFTEWMISYPYKASNLIIVESRNGPEIRSESEIFLRGSCDSSDEDKVCITFASLSKAETFVAHANKALEECVTKYRETLKPTPTLENEIFQLKSI